MVIIALLLWDSKLFEQIDVSTPLGLVAFIVAIIFWYLRYKSLHKRQMLRDLRDDKKLKTAQLILEDLHIDTTNLSSEQRYNLALEKLKSKASHRKHLSLFLFVLALVLLFFILGKQWFDTDPSEDKNISEENIISSQSRSERIEYSIDLVLNKDSLLTRIKKGEKTFLNEHCSPPRDIDFYVYADSLNGWYINKNSIIVTPQLRTNCTYKGIFDITDNSFQLKGKVENSGSCVRLLDKIVSYDARGKIVLSYKYEEFKKLNLKVEKSSAIVGKIPYGESTLIDIPKNTLDYKIRIFESNNTPIIISSNRQSNLNYTVSEIENSKLLLTSLK